MGNHEILNLIESNRECSMATANEKGIYKIQVSLSEKEYQLIRKKAFEMDETVNVALKKLALIEARK